MQPIKFQRTATDDDMFSSHAVELSNQQQQIFSKFYVGNQLSDPFVRALSDMWDGLFTQLMKTLMMIII